MITAYTLSQGTYKPPETIQKLQEYLQAAVEVEHLTIPVYMTGMYSIRPGTNAYAHDAIRSVVLEEMLHMTLAANLLNAVGGTPNVAHPRFAPGYPAQLPFSDKSLRKIKLQHFSPQALETFLLIERPRSLVPPPVGNDPEPGWTSIGQFYEAVREGVEALVDKHGEAAVFSGDHGLQIGPDDFYNSGGEVFPVHGLKDALRAIRTISEQGEGLGDTIWDSDDLLFGEERQVAHYFRFKEIAKGRRFGPYDAPRSDPSGPLLDVTWDDAYKIKDEVKAEAYPAGSDVRKAADAFNERYARLLLFLQWAFTGRPWAMEYAIPVMLELRDLAQRLYRNPFPVPEAARQGFHASPTFELSSAAFDAARPEVERILREAESAHPTSAPHSPSIPGQSPAAHNPAKEQHS